MIVRISNEAQYRLDDSHHHKLDELDDAVVAAIERDDEDAFHETFEELLQLIRTAGTELPEDDLEPSEFILPPADITIAEAREEFSGEGLIPDPVQPGSV